MRLGADRVETVKKFVFRPSGGSLYAHESTRRCTNFRLKSGLRTRFLGLRHEPRVSPATSPVALLGNPPSRALQRSGEAIQHGRPERSLFLPVSAQGSHPADVSSWKLDGDDLKRRASGFRVQHSNPERWI